MLGLSLCGGGIRCAAHVGALKVLHRHGLEFDLIVGVSMGAIVAACYAMDSNPERLERYWLGLRTRDVIGWSLPGATAQASRRFRHFLAELCQGRRIEELPRRLVVLAADLRTGQRVIFERGDLAEALYASCALPWLLAPLRLGDRILVDGGVTDPLPPAALLRERGAQHCIAIQFPLVANHSSPNLLRLLWRCADITSARLAEEARGQFDQVLTFDVRHHSLTDDRRVVDCLRAGEKMTEAALPELLARWAKARIEIIPPATTTSGQLH